MNYTPWIVLVVVVLLGGGLALKLAYFPINTANKEVEIMYDAQGKVLTADNAIYNYEWFKQQKADIDAAKKQLVNARVSYQMFETSAGARATWTFEDKNEDSRLRSVVLGLENNLETKIGNYNARASMATRSIFENSVLPSYIDALTFILN